MVARDSGEGRIRELLLNGLRFLVMGDWKHSRDLPYKLSLQLKSLYCTQTFVKTVDLMSYSFYHNEIYQSISTLLVALFEITSSEQESIYTGDRGSMRELKRLGTWEVCPAEHKKVRPGTATWRLCFCHILPDKSSLISTKWWKFMGSSLKWINVDTLSNSGLHTNLFPSLCMAYWSN